MLLKEYCKFGPELGLLGDLMIDTACLDIPKVTCLAAQCAMPNCRRIRPPYVQDCPEAGLACAEDVLHHPW